MAFLKLLPDKKFKNNQQVGQVLADLNMSRNPDSGFPEGTNLGLRIQNDNYT